MDLRPAADRKPFTGEDTIVSSATVLYFAYGSNMLTRRLWAADRAPSAKPRGIGYVRGRRLTFDKVGRDGSGQCDAEVTGKNTDRVEGVLFEIAFAEKNALDGAEGLGRGYEDEHVEVVADSGTAEAITYIATEKDPILEPYHWYEALVCAGAVEHGLPSQYVEWLRAFQSLEDPNADRRAENQALLPAG